MNPRLPGILLALAAACFSALSATQSQPPRLELLEVSRIWDEAPHNAFTDLIRFNGQWVCGFREASAHAGGTPDSRMRILVSPDGETWKSAALLRDERGDIRDAKLAILPDGRLMFLTAIQKFDTSEYAHQSLAWFTSDLETWDGPHDVGEPNIWLWGITWHKNTGYSIGYKTRTDRFVRLYQTANGTDFAPLVENLEIDDPYPNESKIIFDAHDTAHVLLRTESLAQFGTAQPPYTDWQWQKLDQRIGGPNLIQLPGGHFLGAGRLYVPRARTALFWIDPESGKIDETLTLPSGGDTSYPGLVLHDGILWMSYYSTHEGKSSIYLAKIALHDPAP